MENYFQRKSISFGVFGFFRLFNASISKFYRVHYLSISENTLGTLNFVDPLNSELSEFYRILFSLKPAFTINNNWEFIRFVKEGKTQ